MTEMGNGQNPDMHSVWDTGRGSHSSDFRRFNSGYDASPGLNAGVFFLFKMSSAGCTSGDEAFMNLGNAIPVMGTMQAGQRMASLGKH